MTVPNEFPSLPSTRRLAIVGEAPGENEARIGRPFVGESGRILDDLLSKAGLPRSSCFIGNVCQHRPPNNQLQLFQWNGNEITSGIAALRADLDKFNPHCILLLGATALKLAKDPFRVHPLTPNACRHKIGDWRGSLFAPQDGPLSGHKCCSAYHPAAISRRYGLKPLLYFDLQRAIAEASDPSLSLPQRTIRVPECLTEALDWLREYRVAKLPTATDIEGYWNYFVCISFASDPNIGTVIPFIRKDGTRYWGEEDEPRVWRAVAELLEDEQVPKVLQNSLYDRFCLHFGHRIRVRNVCDDTMLKWWELYAELPKKLAVMTSVLTREPFYKGDRKSNDDRTFWRYSGLDSCVTLECSQVLERALASDQYHKSERVRANGRRHYRLNLGLLNPLLAMEHSGIRYDSKRAAERRQALRQGLFKAQAKLNGLTGHCLSWHSTSELYQRAREVMLVKAGNRPYKDRETDWLQFNYLMDRPPSLATIGEIENLLDVSLNTDSPTFRNYLYEELKLPKQYKKTEEGEDVLTADYEALLKLSKYLQRDSDPRVEIIQTAIEIRALDTRQQMLEISADRDGRIRCTYNVVGSDTGRVQCGKSPTGSGYNLQTIPNYTKAADAPGGVTGDRDLFLADEGYWLFQCDLKGADGWTYAAYAAMLGDSTMLEDYRAGISPFDILTLRLRGVEGDYKSRDWLKEARKGVEKDSWDRFAMKRVQHGAAYLEGGLTISNNILKDSEGKMFLEPRECERIRDQIYFARYPGIKRWHAWVATRLSERPELIAASGQVRKFFGRRDEMLTKAVAFEPQCNTTYATNLAMYRLWTDSDNHNYNGVGFRVRPLHQVHDALLGEFKKEDTEWATNKIKQWFANTLTIAGIPITIPFDGAYGPSWGEQTAGKI